MKDWLDSPVTAYQQRLEDWYWCQRCKERYGVSLRFDNGTGVYEGKEACPFCGHDGVPCTERGEIE